MKTLIFLLFVVSLNAQSVIQLTAKNAFYLNKEKNKKETLTVNIPIVIYDDYIIINSVLFKNIRITEKDKKNFKIKSLIRDEYYNYYELTLKADKDGIITLTLNNEDMLIIYFCILKNYKDFLK